MAKGKERPTLIGSYILSKKKNISQDIKILSSLSSECLKFYTANVNNIGFHTVSTEHVMSMY